MMLTLSMPQSFAKDNEKLQIGWVPTVYTMQTGKDSLLKNDEYDATEQIQEAISNRLRALDSAGRLPFTVKWGASSSLNNVQETVSVEAPLMILPMVAMDDSFDTCVRVDEVKAYRHVIVSGINIAICSASVADDEGVKMLAIVPLSGYTVIGDSAGNPGKIMPKPLSKKEKSKVYAALSVEMIKQMDFDAVTKALKNWQRDKTYPVTTQVDAKISSRKANEIFGQPDEKKQIKNLIANTYSAEYQKNTGRLVMPPATAADFYKDIKDNMYKFEIHGPAGKVKLSMGNPDRKIMLDFAGVAEAVAEGKKASNVRQDIVYKAWLKKEPVEGNEKDTLDEYVVEPQFKKSGAGDALIDIDKKDIYARLQIKLAKKMAAQKR